MNLSVPEGRGGSFTTTTNTGHPIIITHGQDLKRGQGEGRENKAGRKEVVKWKYI